jgi:5-methylcytosine-specific restriction endonuclease McrA
MDTLLLNSDYQPLDVLSWTDALSLLFREKVRVVVSYEDWEVSSPSVTLKVPAVLVLSKYQKHRPLVRFSRLNVYSRDHFQCQYCGVSSKTGDIRLRDLTFDHVIPSSRGGGTSWQNIVTCCERCNRAKADRLPDEAGMTLLKKPRSPQNLNPVTLLLRGKDYPEEWVQFVDPVR